MTIVTHLLTASWLVINYCRRRVNTQSEEEEEEVELSAFLYLKKTGQKLVGCAIQNKRQGEEELSVGQSFDTSLKVKWR